MCGLTFKLLLSLLFLCNCPLEKSVAASTTEPGREVDWDWMETGPLGMVQGGQWLRSSLCPDGSFVNGYQMQYGDGNGTAQGEITGLRLNCSELDQNYKLKTVRFLNANGAKMSMSIARNNSVFVSANRQAVGFSLARWTDSQGFEYVDGRKLTFFGQDANDKKRYKFPKNATSTLFVTVGCPEGWAVCGMQGRQAELMTTPSGSGFEDTEPTTISVLTKLRFKCCYYCIPEERRVLLDDYTNPGSTDYTRTIRKTVGTQFDSRKSSSGSTSSSTDTTNESQVGNSKTIGSSQSESEGQTSSKSESQNESKGWNTGEELRISTSSQMSTEARISDSRTQSYTDSLSVGSSRAQTDGSHWSQSSGTSSSRTEEKSRDRSATAGFSAFGFNAQATVSNRQSTSVNTGRHQESTRGGSSQTETRTNVDISATRQTGSSRDVSIGTSRTASRGIDSSKSQGASGGIAWNREQSRQRSIQKAKERSVQEGVQAMFTQRQAVQQSWQFSWDQSVSLLWREEQEDTFSFTCEAMHRCRIEQIFGTCGALQIRTPKIEKRMDPLKLEANQHIYTANPEVEAESETANQSATTTEIQWELNIPGETWVVAKNISYWESSGHWQNFQICPPHTIVTGHMLKFLPQVGITGIALVCSEKYGPDRGESEHEDVHMLRISSEDEPERNRTKGVWEVLSRGSRSIFAEGYSFTRTEMNGSRSIGNQELIYHDVDLMQIPSQLAINSTRVVTKCPEDHAICGVAAMMDKAEIGILTAIGFRCCHHCIPEEKWVKVYDMYNKSPSEERMEIRSTVGLSRTKASSESNSVNVGNTIDAAGISRSGLHAGFSARFGTSNSTGFDWSHSTNSIWTDETTVTKTYTCAPFHSCVYKKLEGQCGTAHVAVNKFHKVSNPIDPRAPDPVPFDSDTSSSVTAAKSLAPTEYNLEDEPTPVQVTKTGEIWIQASNIQSGNVDPATTWGKSEVCSLGTFVTGYRLLKLGGEDPDTEELVTGLELECSSWDSRGKFKPVKSIQSEQSARGSGRPASGANQHDGDDMIRSEHEPTPSPALGFFFFSYAWFEDEEDGEQIGQSTLGHSLIFDRLSRPQPPVLQDTEYQVNAFVETIVCPTDYVICGVRTRKDEATGVLTDVKFQCCYHCEPSEMKEELEHQRNPTDVTTTHTIPLVSVGADVEVKEPLEPVEDSFSDMFTLKKGFSNYQYLKEMFSHRLPKKSKSKSNRSDRQPKIDWKNQAKSVWTREIENSKGYSCKPGYTCVVSQLVGICGKFHIPTAFFPIQEILIQDSVSEEHEQDEDN